MSNQIRRIASLDGLRAIAILLVLVFHASESDGFPHWMALPSPYGGFGVRIFFVISGYLITTLLLREEEKTGTISLKSFYIRRSYRIFPAAYVFILAVALFGHHLARLKDFLVAIFYVQNYSSHAPIFWHLWSLSIEEQFYLIWPLLFLLFPRRRTGILIAGIAISPIFRGLAYVLHYPSMLQWFPSMEDALATGCLLAVLGTRLDPFRKWIDRLIIPIVVLTVVMLALPYPHGFQPLVLFTLLNVGITLSVDHFIRHPYRLLNNPPIEWIGRLSYSLYLWQEPFLFVRSLHGWWTRFPANFAMAFLFACASYYLVEKPVLAFRDRRMKARRLQSASQPGNEQAAEQAYGGKVLEDAAK
ncbi:acyltransferase family protein [Silvibacterium acidisoli]|uniref:acyltransferase family protein n=1 Tax=Acidobacteriaceae bacterium ZG23-2 TaxID=2883246 RepID=UPI00406C5641